ncbi:hypothetical protein RI138_32220 [Streptomyces sp. C11-1]|uniref:Uncharacterized protein n=1 Tax=Streptomyces durocortorensis TaxID=2811104 RepID=A0ABY9W4M1_9ACTN|nr:hypothetical protein [Streptomyces durocortorensis]WNF31115.1 hypothetical protein RI138_32220 [Streptomyces durocortorensis]
MTTATEKRAPEDIARRVARNAIPDVNEALELMKLQGPVQVGDVKDCHGTVLITLRSGDAYEFARWVCTRAARKEAQQTSARSHG